MALVLLALAAGLAAGYARRGRLRRLAAHPPIRSRLILTALGLYALGVAGSWAWEPLLPTLTALCWFTLGFYAWLNRGYHGARLIALGLAANGLVIMLNGAMPISTTAQERAGVAPTVAAGPGNGASAPAGAEPAEETGRVTAIGDGTTLPFLGKVVPVAFPPRPEVVSPGDIAVAAGCAAALATGMTGRRTTTAGAQRSTTGAPRRTTVTPPPPPPPAQRDEDHIDQRAEDGSEASTERATMDADVTADAQPESPRVTA